MNLRDLFLAVSIACVWFGLGGSLSRALKAYGGLGELLMGPWWGAPLVFTVVISGTQIPFILISLHHERKHQSRRKEFDEQTKKFKEEWEENYRRFKTLYEADKTK